MDIYMDACCFNRRGVGDYTAERAELLADLTSMEDIKRELDRLRAQKRDVAE